jgi:hypothetical protein
LEHHAPGLASPRFFYSMLRCTYRLSVCVIVCTCLFANGVVNNHVQELNILGPYTAKLVTLEFALFLGVLTRLGCRNPDFICFPAKLQTRLHTCITADLQQIGCRIHLSDQTFNSQRSPGHKDSCIQADRASWTDRGRQGCRPVHKVCASEPQKQKKKTKEYRKSC